MLPQQRGAGDFRRKIGELDRAADSQILAALLLLHLDDRAAGAQGRIVFDFLHRQNRSAWHVELAQNFDGFEFGLVSEPLLNLSENIEDFRLPRPSSSV